MVTLDRAFSHTWPERLVSRSAVGPGAVVRPSLSLGLTFSFSYPSPSLTLLLPTTILVSHFFFSVYFLYPSHPLLFLDFAYTHVN